MPELPRSRTIELSDRSVWEYRPAHQPYCWRCIEPMTYTALVPFRVTGDERLTGTDHRKVADMIDPPSCDGDAWALVDEQNTVRATSLNEIGPRRDSDALVSRKLYLHPVAVGSDAAAPLYLYRVPDTDDAGDPVDFGSVRANNSEELATLLRERFAAIVGDGVGALVVRVSPVADVSVGFPVAHGESFELAVH